MAKKRKYNKSTGRTYKYDTKYQSSPEQVRNRVARNRARRQLLAHLSNVHGKVKAKIMMKDKDVDHKKALSKGGSRFKMSNLRLLTMRKNRAKDRPRGPRKKKRR
jgi:5-methylcytosine-specific restriction endonuclease McrA